MEYKKFKAYGHGDEGIRVALTTGHVFIIPNDDWVKIPEFAWKEVFASGAVSEDTIKADSITKDVLKAVEMKRGNEDKKQQIKAVVQGWVDDNELDKFNKDGKPSSPLIAKEVGFAVTNGVRDEVWFLMQEGME